MLSYETRLIQMQITEKNTTFFIKMQIALQACCLLPVSPAARQPLQPQPRDSQVLTASCHRPSVSAEDTGTSRGDEVPQPGRSGGVQQPRGRWHKEPPQHRARSPARLPPCELRAVKGVSPPQPHFLRRWGDQVSQNCYFEVNNYCFHIS